MTDQTATTVPAMRLSGPDWTFTSTRRGHTIKVDIKVERDGDKVYVQLCSQDGLWFVSTRATLVSNRVSHTVSDDFGLTVIQNMVGRVSAQSTCEEFASALALDLVNRFHETKW